MNDIIDVSQIGMEKAPLRRIQFEVHSEISELLAILKKQEHKIIFTYKKSSGIPEDLIGDPVRLKQTISSLIRNSIQFMNGTEVIVRSDLLLKSERNCIIRFSLNCLGSGISKQVRTEFLEKFYNVEEPDSNDNVDILMPKNLVETMGGSIRFNFDNENDFTFVFELPFDLVANT